MKLNQIQEARYHRTHRALDIVKHAEANNVHESYYDLERAEVEPAIEAISNEYGEPEYSGKTKEDRSWIQEWTWLIEDKVDGHYIAVYVMDDLKHNPESTTLVAHFG